MENGMSEQPSLQDQNPQPPELDLALLERGLQQLRAEQNIGLAIGGGVAAAAVGAILWTAITVATEYQIGFMAIGVGFLVGWAVRVSGKGIDKPFGVVGAVCALLGCLVGNLLTACYFLAAVQKTGLVDVFLSLNPVLAAKLLSVTFSPMDLLFYGIAVYEGYRFSFRPLTPHHLLLAGQTAPAASEAF
jgi:hypothetical protein